MRIVVNVLELVGFVSIVAGLYLLAPWAALVAGGVMLVLFALGLERGEPKK